MSIRQSKMSELRYMKRQNLDHEAKLVGNYYRDIIRSYGIDCNYYKLDTTKFTNYKSVADKNTILLHAYGFDDQPDYSISAQMLTYMEVENDIFQLNKFGLNPEMEVNFYFDSTDFACALATKLGRYEEFKIDETEITCEVPLVDETSSHVFPYELGLGYAENFKCGLLEGKIACNIGAYEPGKEYTVQCRILEHNDFSISFPANEYIAKSFKHKYTSDDYIDNCIMLTYKVEKLLVDPSEDDDRKKYRCILKGKLHGAILFYDLSEVGKYADQLHPYVGDVVSIDFPDEKNREKYEITECIDKQLTQDGINPLLHKYVWKCKAKRYNNSHEAIEPNEGDDRLEERLQQAAVVREDLAKKISIYDDGQDAVYGGYERLDVDFDKNKVDESKPHRHIQLDDGTAIDILHFSCGTKLVTNGYDLIFVNKDGMANLITFDNEPFKFGALFEEGLKFIKATDTAVVFVNINGEAYKIAEDRQATANELELCLEQLCDKTLEHDNTVNSDGDTFYKFGNTKTLLWSTPDHLFCRLESNKKVFLLV